MVRAQSFIAPTPEVLRGPPAFPLVGVLPRLRKDPLAFLMSTALEYGDLASLGRVMGKPWFFASSAELTQEVLQTRAKHYGRGASLKFLRILGSDNLGSWEGEPWLRRRRLLQPVFGHRQVEVLADLMVERLSAQLDRWDESAKADRPIEIGSEMVRMAMEVSLAAQFGTRSEENAAEIADAVSTVFDYLQYRAMNPLALGLAAPTAKNRAYKRSCALLNQVVNRVIKERRERGSPSGGDLLSILMDARDAETGAPLTDAQLHDQVIEFLMAGHETTSTALTWTWSLLLDHPEVLDRVTREVEAVVGARRPTFADLFELKYLRMVWDEALRLYPPLWLYPRVPYADETLGGHRIPAGSMVFVSPWVLHHHPAYWRDPDTFDPERFSPDRKGTRPSFAYMPFGGGPRVCIGRDFATTEAMLVIAMIVRRYALAGHARKPPRPKLGLLMRLDGDLKVTPRLRAPGEPAARGPLSTPELPSPAKKSASRCPFHFGS